MQCIKFIKQILNFRAIFSNTLLVFLEKLSEEEPPQEEKEEYKY